MAVRCGNLRVSNTVELTHFHEWKTQQKEMAPWTYVQFVQRPFGAEAVSSSRDY